MEQAVSFFSESDMTVMKDGRKVISSEYPMWYNRQMFEELREDITMAEHEIKVGRLSDEKLVAARNRLSKLQEKLQEVEDSIPVATPAVTDKMAKVRKELGKEISARMFSRSDMKKGLADAHEEVRRMENPSIKVTEDIAEIAAACNVKISDGRISRTQAEKIWKISSRFLDETSNTEQLRRD